MWFNGRSEHRILAWREFRRSLDTWPNDLDRVAAVWAKAPLINHLHQDHPEQWPDPWELISSNIYCDIGVALGMLYTLYYSSYPHRESLRIVGYKLRSSHKEVNLVICEREKYVLNYELGSVVNTPDFFQSESPTYNYTVQEMRV